MRRNFALQLIIFWVYLEEVWGEERLLRTPNGPVRGYKEPEDTVFTFYGIPYATAPTGTHRFKAPLPAPMWFEPYDAVDKGIICPQPSLGNLSLSEIKTVDENCLIANVFVPETAEKKLPVVVIVHGGAYQIGFGNMLHPKNLVKSKNVIAVTFNYRVGIYGFLCLGTNDAPGNAGLKDQVALLRWVNKNIASFGGNPDDVTLLGYSAGASAVELLMFSPSAKGLFNKVIPESGSSISPWSIQIDPVENARYFAKTAGFSEENDVYALEEFYTSASYDFLTSTGGFWNRTDGAFLFTPCVERKTTEEPFLLNNPYNILKSGKYKKVPMLYGLADMEGLLRIAEFDTWKDLMNKNFTDFLPVDLKFESEDVRDEVSNKIKEFYFGTKPISQESVLPYINYMTDLYFGYSTLRAIQLHVEAGHDKIYLYEYNFVDDATPTVPYTDNIRGANHCAQTAAILDIENEGHLTTSEDKSLSEEMEKMKSVMREIWANFIKTGTPVPPGSTLPEWPPAGASGSPYMSLGSELHLRGALLEERVRFWDSIYERHYSAPQPPPTPPSRHTEL